MNEQRIAILGAGMLGTCLALEMAYQGIKVDLYDREANCLTQAGMRNEGKIHLAFVYGADFSLKTTEKMIDGAMSFLPLLRRWVGSEINSIGVSRPFFYAVAEDSILSPKQFELHCQKIEVGFYKYNPSDYPGELLPKAKKLSNFECKGKFNLKKIQAVYRTCERAVDIRAIAQILQKKIAHTPNITFFPHSTIEQINQRIDSWQLKYSTFSEPHEKSYDIVINALWDGRMAIDEQAGLHDPPPWCYRLKHAIFLTCTSSLEIPSTTIVQGPYGDLVNFGQGRYYLSWYLKCMQGFVKNTITPPNWNRNLSEQEAKDLAIDSIRALSEYMPQLKKMNEKNIRDLSVLGGIIYARGETDVEDPNSGLHTRYELGIRNNKTYYSINPGKYSLCPAFAYTAAAKICSELCLSTSSL